MYVTCIVPCMSQVQDQAAAPEDETTCRKSTSNSGLWTTVVLQEAGLVKLPPLHKRQCSFYHHYDEPGLASAPLSSSIPRSTPKSHPETSPAPEVKTMLRWPPRWSNLR